MPPSQLKQLKHSLRENGITNSSQSKKRKRDDSSVAQDRAHRQAVLENLRDNFKPFDKKANSRPRKFEALSLENYRSKNKSVVGRPGLSKARGEEIVCCNLAICVRVFSNCS